MFSYLTIFYFIAWLIVFIYYYHHKKTIGIYGAITLSYVIYAFLSIWDYSNHPEEYTNITFWPYVYLFVLLLIALIPVKQYDDTHIFKLIGISPKVCYFVFFLFIITTVVVLPNAITRIQHGYEMMLASDDGASELYQEMHAQTSLNANRNAGFWGICNIIRYLLFEICVFCFFYYLTLPKQNKTLIITLLSSFSIDIFVSFSNGGRTTSTMVGFTIFMTYLVFYQFYGQELRKKSKRLLSIMGGILLLLTAIVTISRTIDREGGASEGMVHYLGQGNLYFNQYAITSDGQRGGDRTCNYFKRMLGFKNVPPSITGVREKHSSMKLSDHHFSTFIGDFVLDFGPIVTFIGIFLFSIFFYYVTKPQHGTVYLEQLLLIQLVADICMHGGMYLFYYSFSGNYILIMYVLFYWFIKFCRGTSMVVTLKRV